MILYAVELEMAAALRDEYLAWLNVHVREMLALPGVLGAEIMVPVEPPPPRGAGSFVPTIACATAPRGEPTWSSTPRACVKPASRVSAIGQKPPGVSSKPREHAVLQRSLCTAAKIASGTARNRHCRWIKVVHQRLSV